MILGAMCTNAHLCRKYPDIREKAQMGPTDSIQEAACPRATHDLSIGLMIRGSVALPSWA